MAGPAAPRRIHPRHAHPSRGQSGDCRDIRRAGSAVVARPYGAGGPAGEAPGPRRGTGRAGLHCGRACVARGAGESPSCIRPGEPSRLSGPLRHRTSRYLNNRLEQDHRGIKLLPRLRRTPKLPTMPVPNAPTCSRRCAARAAYAQDRDRPQCPGDSLSAGGDGRSLPN